MSLRTIKKQFKAYTTVPQDEHLASGNCKKVMDGLLVPPMAISSTTISSTALKVGKGNICRIRVTAQTYIQFGAANMIVPVGTEANSLELDTAGVYLVVASDDFIMASLNPARLEVIDAIYDTFGTADTTANPTDPQDPVDL